MPGCATVAGEESEELTKELEKEQSEALRSSQQDWDQAETHGRTTRRHQQTDDRLLGVPTQKSRIGEFFVASQIFPPFFLNSEHKGWASGDLRVPVYMKNNNDNKKKFLYKIHMESFSYFYWGYSCTETETRSQRIRTTGRGQVLYRFDRRFRTGDVQ